MKIHGDTQSGNCYKLKLLLALLDRPHTWVAVDILRGESHLPDFLAKNPNGKIPLLELGEYPEIRAWLARMVSLPRYVGMDDQPGP